MSDTKFIDGLIVKPPHEKAPEYVKAKISIKVHELREWLGQQHGDWVNLDVKVSQSGKWYASIDDWKPDGKRGDRTNSSNNEYRPRRQNQASRPQTPPVDDFADDNIPF